MGNTLVSQYEDAKSELVPGLHLWLVLWGDGSSKQGFEKRRSFMIRYLNNSCQWSDRNEERNGTRL